VITDENIQWNKGKKKTFETRWSWFLATFERFTSSVISQVK